MMEEARASLFVRHHVEGNPSCGFGETVGMLGNNAALASRYFGRQLGVLSPGAAADLIVVEHRPFTPASPDNVWGQILFGAAAEPVHTTICAGEVLMHDHQLRTLDPARIAAEAAQRSPATWQRFGS